MNAEQSQDMAPASRVLKFDRTDDESRYVLLNVTSRGSKPLDLRIEATEGDEEYAQNCEYLWDQRRVVRRCFDDRSCSYHVDSL